MLRALLLLMVAPAIVHAESSVKVSLNEDGQVLADRLGISVPQLIERARTKITELFKIARLDELLLAFADAGSFSQRTAGVDYDPDPGRIIVGAAATGVRADIALGSEGGWMGSSVVNVTAMAGLNLARWNRPRWTVFVNGFYQSTTIRGLEGSLLTLGSHAQYRVVAGNGRGRLRWTGISVTSGLEFAHWTIGESADAPIDTHFTAEGSDGAVVDKYTIHMSSMGRLDATSRTVTIPAEVTTGVRLFERIGVYGGGGIALTEGSSTIVARLNSELSFTADRIPVGNAQIIGSGSSEPSTTCIHALLGLVVRVGRMQVFGQGVTASGMSSLSIGVRAAL